MLKISYKLKGLMLNELWFASKMQLNKTMIMTGLYCYRQATFDIDTIGLKKEKLYTLINDLRDDKEKIFSTFKSNVRNEIRKADKIESFTLSCDYDSKEIFLEAYRDFAKAKNLPMINKKSIDKYGNNIFYIKGYLNGELTNIQLYLLDRESGIVRLQHSISTLYKEQNIHRKAQIGWINHSLHWKTILEFKDLGFSTFDWGGYTNNPHSPLAGIDKFKASHGGVKVVRYNYYTLPYYALKKIQERLFL